MGVALAAAGCGSGLEPLRMPPDTNAVAVEVRRVTADADESERAAAELLAKIRDMEAANRTERHILRHNLACVYRQAGRFVDAEREYQEALRLDPSAADSRLGLGLLYEMDLKQPDKARECFERFLALAPDSPHAVNVRERLAKLAGKTGAEGVGR